MNTKPDRPRRIARRNRYRLYVALLTFLVGALSYYAPPFVCCSSVNLPNLFHVYNGGPEWKTERLAVLLRFSAGGQFVVGFGWGDMWANQRTLDEVGQGDELAGFLLSYRWRVTSWGTIDNRWIMAGLPWWFIAALIFRKRLERIARKWAATPKAKGRLELRRYRHKRMIDARRFNLNPVCEKCGYDMRATRKRCPECGWFSNFPKLPEEGDA